MQQTTLNGYIFHYEEKGDGEPLILVHGSASDYRTWENQLNTFSNEYRTITYSRRYHHPNKKIEEGQDYSMAEHLEDLKAFIQDRSNDAVHLVGHSYGGFLGLLLAIDHPELIRSMTVMEPPIVTLHVSNKPKAGELFKLFLKKPRTAWAILKFGAMGISPATSAFKQGDHEKALEIFGKATLGKATYYNLTEERKEQSRINLMKQELLGSGFLPLDKSDVEKISVPVLLTRGEESPKLLHYLMDDLKQLLPHAEHFVISGASHIMHEDNASHFNEVLRTFLHKQSI